MAASIISERGRRTLTSSTPSVGVERFDASTQPLNVNFVTRCDKAALRGAATAPLYDVFGLAVAPRRGTRGKPLALFHATLALVRRV